MSYTPSWMKSKNVQENLWNGSGGSGTIWREDTDYWNHDLDDYDMDGNLKSSVDNYNDSSTYSSRIYDYGKKVYNTATSASARWVDKYSSTYDSWRYKDLGEEERKQKELNKELRTIARAVNSVRNTSGKSRERNLKVVWAKEGQHNSVVADSNIYLSPDPLSDEHTLRPDWDKAKRRDSVIGDSLTVVGMKRQSTPMAVKKIMKTLELVKVKFDGMGLVGIDDSVEIENSDLLRSLGVSVFKSVEQDSARTAILKEYRGSAPYFASNQLYNASDEAKKKVEEKVAKFSGDVDSMSDEDKQGISLAATALVNWNINNSLIPDNQISIPDNSFGSAIHDAMEILSQTENSKNTAERWTTSYEAASHLAALEPTSGQENEDGEDGTSKVPSSDLNDLLNNNMENMFNEVSNVDDVSGEQETENIEDESAEGLTEASTNCRMSSEKSNGEASERLNRIREDNKPMLMAMAKKLDPISELQVLPEHGLRSGKLSASKLWKVTTNMIDSDRVFHRKVVTGVSRKLHIGVLLDYSYSMQSKDLSQKKVAVLMHDLLNRYSDITVEFYGHQGDEYNNKITKFEDIGAVVNHSIDDGTEEGSAYAFCAKQILNNAEIKSRKVLFAIGDGETNTDNVKRAVDLARKVGIETVDILINHNVERAQETAEECFGKGQVVAVSPHQNLEEQISRVLGPWLFRLMSKMRKQSI